MKPQYHLQDCVDMVVIFYSAVSVSLSVIFYDVSVVQLEKTINFIKYLRIRNGLHIRLSVTRNITRFYCHHFTLLLVLVFLR